MRKDTKFKKKIIASCISSLMLVPASQVLAQQEESKAESTLEEVVVTGLRSSLQRSMDTKRNMNGVVDAISAEDIGKFPDTNLAESLQRISGVSIDRVNGEGSQVTVRGFGAEFNSVTLNGRMMPGASVYGGGSGAGGTVGGSTRAFDFANLASESVAGVDVYKTGRASVTTGGIGASVNIKTTKPLDNPGLHVTTGIKAVYDTTNDRGNDVTPELSGQVSWTDEDEKFGVALSLSSQERHSGSRSIAENNWNIGVWGEDNLFSFAPDAEIVNAPDNGQLFGRPNDIRYAFSDNERTRTNAQLTLQYAPTDNITASIDYTYAENQLFERRGESTSWLANGNSIDRVVFDDSAVATPIFIGESTGQRDQGFAQQVRQQENTLDSIGFNLDWQVNDRFSLNLDVHDSSMESLPTGPGNSGEIEVSLALASQVNHSIDFSGDLPIYTVGLDDSGGRGNGNGVADIGDIGSQVVRVFYADQATDITQAKLDGAFEFENGSFNFGVETRGMEMRERSSNRYMAMGDWGVANPGDIPEDLLEPFNLSNFDDFDASASFQGGFRGNAEDIGQALVDLYGTAENGYTLSYEDNFQLNDIVQEDTQAIYGEIAFSGDIGGMETNTLVGLRYETTDVTSSSLQRLPLYLLWQDNNDFQTVQAEDPVAVEVKESYDNLLPSLDFDVAFNDEVKGRFSYSKTIARTGYSNLKSSVSNYASGGGSTFLGAIPTASSANPGLLPLESDNFDLSVEWYFDDASYISLGVFEKRVKNFVGTEQVDRTLFGVRDQTSGPRAQAAAAALTDAGFALDDTALFVMMAMLDNGMPASAYTGELSQQISIATAFDLVPNADDPLTLFRVSQPVNNREAEIHGIEVAGQHFFGDSGFGLAANYTVVSGDVGFDNTASPGESQFALLGLSDTANLVAMYEKNGIQARVAYNWRDQYLRSASQGSSRNPVYVEAYSQIDVNVSYDVNDNLSVFVEGINITGENRRDHGRSDRMIEFLQDLGARYHVGARYTF